MMTDIALPKIIGIQGIKGCFHEMAARKYYHAEPDLVECNTFRELCYALKNGKCEQAIMAIENTLAGSILPNYSLIRKHGFFVSGEVYLHIKMNLMANHGVQLSDVREVMSHPVALAQCDDFLEKLDAELIEYHDTAAAAKWVKDTENTNTAALASDLSAELYDLNVLAEGIETNKQNYTRFLILSRERIDVEGADKASLSLELSHSPGSLADVLTVFKMNGVNLTKIQSIPIIGKPYQYAFKIDVTWSNYPDYEKSIEHLRVIGCTVDVLGEYKSEDYAI